MFYRCVSNLFGYCSSVPDWETEPEMQDIKDEVRSMTKIPVGGVCKRNWREYKKFRTLEQVLEKAHASDKVQAV